MKRYILLFAALLGLSYISNAQNVWERPVVEASKTTETKIKQKTKSEEDPKYLAGAVPVVDGRVQWTLDVDAKGKSAQEIYDIMLKYLTELTGKPNQLEGSQVSLVNKQEHKIVAKIREWMVFTDKFLALDRTKIDYMLMATCTDGHLNMTMSRIGYRYEENRGNHEVMLAEDWITDKEAIKKNGKSFYKNCGKFRKKTIDRKDELFETITEILTK